MSSSDSIFTSCRKGDLTRIRYLVEKREIDLNVRDCWDSTPLYYACHCGHQLVVEYLLANGGRCEANTFDGERCLYGALTNEIKQLLLDSKIVNASNKKRDDFDAFCERMLQAEEFSDFSVQLGQKEFKLHRCILAARSEYFKNTLHKKWRTTSEVKTNAIMPKVFNDWLQYAYTGRITVDREHFEDICRLSDQCKVRNLTDYLRDAQSESEFFESSKKRVKISTLIVSSPQTRNDLVGDFGTAIHPGIPEEFRDPFHHLKCCAGVMDSEDSDVEIMDPIYDLCFQVEGHRFYCNKVFVCTRSEYFNALARDHFSEIEEHDGIPIIILRNVKPCVLTCVLYYIYTNSPVSLNEDIVLELLEAADVYLLHGLKRHCANYLCEQVSLENIIELLKIARMHDLSKLEDRCSEFIAQNIARIASYEDFRQFVISDAQEVEGREETDTISIIDDIRYHIACDVGTFSELEEAQSKLKIIDDLLDDLGLEA